MDLDLDRLDWDDVFDDELAALLGLAPSLPALLPQDTLAYEAGVSTPDQDSYPPSASVRLATRSQPGLQHHFEGTLDGLDLAPALPAVCGQSHPSPCGPTFACGGSLSDPSPDASACGTRRPAPSSLSQPTEHVNNTRGASVALQVPSSREAPSDQGTKRHKVDVKEERRKQQNKKDQQAYRARNKVRFQPLSGRAPHGPVRTHCTTTEQPLRRLTSMDSSNGSSRICCP